MANLLGQNIGANYRGILNLDTTINTFLKPTLSVITDGMGNFSQLFLSTTQVNIGGGSSTGRLTVRGDGTNPIASFETNGGVRVVSVRQDSGLILGDAATRPSIAPFSSTGASFDLTGSAFGFTPNSQVGYSYWLSNAVITSISAESGFMRIYGVFSAAAGSANFRPINLSYTINNSGAQAGTATGIFLNATETALNGMIHSFMTFQRGGIDIFSVSRTGLVSCSGISFASAAVSSGRILASSDGAFVLYNSAANNFNRLQFGGQNLSFSQIAVDTTTTSNLIVCLADSTAGGALGVGMARATGVNASAVLQADSVTKGFLPPRMTTTQINAISSPAEGLQVYNTTINHMCFYMNGAWARISHSPM